MKRIKRLGFILTNTLVASLITTSVVTPAMACDLCAIHIAKSASQPQVGGLLIGSKAHYTRYEGTASAFAPVSPIFLEEQSFNSTIIQLYAQYRASEKIWFQTSIPYIYRDFKRLRNTRIEKGEEYGFGDTSVLLGYEPVQIEEEDYSLRFNLYGGVKFPTGDDDRLEEEQQESDALDVAALLHATPDGNLISGSELALGTGSIDIPLGASIWAQKDKFFFELAAQYAIRTEGGSDFRYGNGFFADVGPGVFLFYDHKKSLALKVALSADFKDKDKLNGEEIARSDQNRMFIGPQLRLTISDQLLASLGIDFSIADDNELEGVQAKHKVSAALSYRF